MSRFVRILGVVTVLVATLASVSDAQAPIGSEQYTVKIYAVNSAYYPIVQVYMRTWDTNRDPLVNVNYANIGVMVKGQNYDPAIFDPVTRNFQYGIETLQNRPEGIRTVLVIDCSLSMKGKPFADAQNALRKYVEAKRPADQIAILAIRDTSEGYQRVSDFTKDPVTLYQLISDIQCDGQKTRLYDTVAAAYEMCGTSSEGASGEYSVLSTIIIFSDGRDEGSSVARDELMNRIGDFPIPIYSLAYSNVDKSYFGNLEALSKGSFGRYWVHAESQEIASTTQKIHNINRSDYVVTFRSYVPVDGNKHQLKVGISYPSNTGRFVFGSSEFEAIDSPTKYIAELMPVYQKLMIQYPELPSKCPYMGCDQTAMSPEELATIERERLEAEEAARIAAEEAARIAAEEADKQEEGDKSLSAVLNENGGLIGLGVGIVGLVFGILVWVKKSGNPQQPQSGGLPPTYPGAGRAGTDPKLGSSDKETRF